MRAALLIITAGILLACGTEVSAKDRNKRITSIKHASDVLLFMNKIYAILQERQEDIDYIKQNVIADKVRKVIESLPTFPCVEIATTSTSSSTVTSPVRSCYVWLQEEKIEC
uniref:Uncharacterized protein n=1 Tax=Amphimedon queenslandica TaxID=400682 RepID=A0A1X7V5Q1_AMPQE